MLAALVDGLNASGAGGTGATGVRRTEGGEDSGVTRNGTNLSTVLSIIEMCWGDVGLLLSMPRQGLGNAAIASVADDEQLRASPASGPRWRSPNRAAARTPPPSAPPLCSTATTTSSTARRSSSRPANAPTPWSSGPPWTSAQGRAAIKSFVVEKGTPGMVVERLEHKLGIRASDTAHDPVQRFRVPAANLLGDPEINAAQGFAGVMQTFDNTRPLVAAMAVGVARAALDETRDLLAEAGVEIDYDRPANSQSARPRRPTCRWRPTGRPHTC